MDQLDPSPRPLADRLRPRQLDQVFGQGHLLAPGKPLYQAIISGQPHSMVLWGPPGTGKTTLARLVAHYCEAVFIPLSAVMAGVKDVRNAVEQARRNWREQQRRTLLFVDEVHRFNKAQQDAFLPYIEDGTLLFIGATTENPSFALNNALLSRLRVYVLKSLSQEDLVRLLERAINDSERGLGQILLDLSEGHKRLLAQAADGDGRRVLVLAELVAELVAASVAEIDIAVQSVISEGNVRRFDKGGDEFYDQISALHKSLRGSDPDAALYWLARMLDGGCDPHYIARRLVRMASEDIGNADPRALAVALDAWDSYTRLGSPEGDLALAQAVVFLACAAKSNTVYKAFKAALDDVRRQGSLPVPMHLRNAPTQLMKELGHSGGYRYPHDEIHGYSPGVDYFPERLRGRRYYQPVERGLEKKIKAKLEFLQKLNTENKQ